MFKWIRWSGLVGFIVIVALIVVFWMFAAGPIIKMGIEHFGSKAAKAQVNVEDVSFALNPLAIKVVGVQVANRKAPMENLFSFDEAVATIEPFPLLLGKAIIPDLALTGVATGTARSTSGALENRAQAEKKSAESSGNEDESSSAIDSVASKLPSADTILEREALLTEQRGKAFEQAYEQHQADINKAISELPTEQSVKNYEKQLNQIVDGSFKSLDDFKQRKRALEQLQKDVKRDKQAIADAKTTVKMAKRDMQNKWSQLQKAPGQDIENIKGKYTMDAQGTANITGLLFGENAGGYAATALEYYEIARPYLVNEDLQEQKQEAKEKRLEGRFVQFETDRPQPDFWIKQTRFTMTLPDYQTATGALESAGDVAVNIYDITHQQDVINRAMRIEGVGQNLKTMASLTLNGQFDHRIATNAGQGLDELNLTVSDWRLKDMKLGLAGLNLDETLAQVSANARLVGSQLDANGQVKFTQSTFSSNDSTVLAKEMVAALRSIDQFRVNAFASGRYNKPDVRINSDLDRQLEAAFDERIAQKQKELEQKLKQKLNQKLLSYAGDYQEKIAELNLTEGSLEDKQKALESLAKAELADYEAQLKAEAEAKAAKKKAELEAKAKAEADRKRKELEEKAKDKLKDLF